MSFREKSAWITLLLDLGVYGYYAWTLYEVVVAGHTETFEYGDLLISLIVILIIAEIVLQSVLAGSTPNEANAPADEREKLISLKATNIAYTFAIVGAFTFAGAIAFGQPPFYTANGLFLVIVFAEVVRNTLQVIYFRLGA